MARTFLPALRGIETKSLQGPSSDIETKSLNGDISVSYGGPTGSAYTSRMTLGMAGDRDRAAGWDLNGRVMQSYEQGVWTFKCVEYISGHQSRLPFRIGSGRGTENEQVLADHPLYRVMNKQANPAETGRQFRKRLSAQLLLSKRGVFVEVTKSRAGTITRLDLLDPSRCRPVPNDEGDDYIKHFEYFDRHGAMREIDPERIRWIRDPHPIDPFCGVTPLEAAGVSIQLDLLARLYNISYLHNDGRPGGIVGIDTDGLEDDEIDRISRVFAPGALRAGEIKVVGTGPNGLNYVDTSTKPRDMAYSEMSTAARNEILSAFGLGESLFGNASGRTFDNAEQEKYNAWSETLIPHFDLFTSAFDGDVEEELDPFIDTRTVDVLEIPRRKRREEALQEWNAGLRSANEYRPLAGLPILDNAYARAIWISPSKAPVPGRPGDEAALGLTDPNAPVEGAAPQGEVTAAQTVAEARGELPTSGGPAADAVAQARGEQPALPAGDAAQTVAEARALPTGGQPAEAAAAVDEARQRLEGKALDPQAPAEPISWEPDQAQITRLETSIAAALDATTTRQAGVLTARLESPKARKGTRFWTPETAADTRTGVAPIDTAEIVQADRWAEETEETLQPLIESAAVETAAAVLALLAAGGVLGAGGAAGAAGAGGAAAYAQTAASLTAGPAAVALAAATAGMRAWLRDVQRKIEMEQLTADRVEQLVEVTRQAFADGAHEFATRLAGDLAHAVVLGSAEAVAAQLLPLPNADGELTAAITTTWVTMGDDRVRPTHREVNGTTVPGGMPFLVGVSLLRYPGDPAGPPEEVLGCRCSLRLRVARSASLLLPPERELVRV